MVRIRVSHPIHPRQHGILNVKATAKLFFLRKLRFWEITASQTIFTFSNLAMETPEQRVLVNLLVNFIVDFEQISPIVGVSPFLILNK